MTDLRTTALHAAHETLGATMTAFGGWQMPLHYGSQLAEHRAVREAAGLFDLSHMGTVSLTGAGAAAGLDRALVGNISVLEVGQAKYTLMCTPEGGIIDDLITYRLEPERFLVVPNAGNTAAVVTELIERTAGTGAKVSDDTATAAMLAVQGPHAAAILAAISDTPADVERLAGFRIRTATLAGIVVDLARTGYTGEDGFEILVPAEHALALWGALLAAGAEHGLVTAGLGARDSLRLEAAMPLYGQELTRDTDPFTVGLGGIVGLRRKSVDFVGREALVRAREAHRERAPGRRVLVGLAGEGRRAARPGQPVLDDGAAVGVVTSGLPSPTLGFPIALALVDPSQAEPGSRLEVDVRGRREAFTVVERPFYRRPAPPDSGATPAAASG